MKDIIEEAKEELSQRQREIIKKDVIESIEAYSRLENEILRIREKMTAIDNHLALVARGDDATIKSIISGYKIRNGEY